MRAPVSLSSEVDRGPDPRSRRRAEMTPNREKIRAGRNYEAMSTQPLFGAYQPKVIPIVPNQSQLVLEQP